MTTITTTDKKLAACILATIKGARLGAVRAMKEQEDIVVTLEVKFSEELSNDVQEVIKEFNRGSLKIDARLFTKEYGFVEHVVKIRSNRIK
ncbi:hypothetical protein [Fictibacillus fluitans]|uniref:Uncharacterized protein n=1 Tax=Fictibacillus fluitans TaxID=3058422 RepID=A0ABT8HQZ2_9BACL|nr:hypothetical protein [Fictibacillus sp. NE201]MDN4523178.1 hypothetical protein [Fictibacillus sp. NE201]